MKHASLFLFLALLFPSAAWARQQKIETKPALGQAPIQNPLVRKSHLKRNLVLTGALWTATALDIRSSNRLDPTRYREVNILGGTGGQIATSALATGAAFLIDRYAGNRWRWLGSLLLGGATAAHGIAAIHNYTLK
jgi:hypothetical protein